MSLQVPVNDDPIVITKKVADLAIGDGFLCDSGKCYQKVSATRTFCQDNGVGNDVGDFGDTLVPVRVITAHHKAATA